MPYRLISPNPAQEVMRFNLTTLQGSEINASVYDVSGRIVFSRSSECGSITGNSFTIDSSEFPSGFYTVVLRSGNAMSVANCVVLR